VTTPQRQPIERNLAMELVRTTEAAAMSAVQYMGRGDKELVDQAAVDAMRFVLDSVGMRGVVVIGEGEKDEAPMLYNGEEVGDGTGPEMDIAVDPIDGTTLLSKGLPGAIAVIAISSRGTMNVPQHIFYMNKIAVGPEARGVIDIDAPVKDNLQKIAKAIGKRIEDVTVIMLDRPRHADLLREVREAGARVKQISDGDVAGGIQAALPNSGVDVLMGVGGSPEGVITAAAIRCTGGEILCKAWPEGFGSRRRPGEGLQHGGHGRR
jgi:fructose-1,6-bisphosphatase II